MRTPRMVHLGLAALTTGALGACAPGADPWAPGAITRMEAPSRQQGAPAARPGPFSYTPRPGTNFGWGQPILGGPTFMSEAELRSLLDGNTVHVARIGQPAGRPAALWHLRGDEIILREQVAREYTHERRRIRFEGTAICGYTFGNVCVRARRDSNGTVILSRQAGIRSVHSPRDDAYVVTAIERGDPYSLVAGARSAEQRMARDYNRIAPILPHLRPLIERSPEQVAAERERCRANPRLCP